MRIVFEKLLEQLHPIINGEEAPIRDSISGSVNFQFVCDHAVMYGHTTMTLDAGGSYATAGSQGNASNSSRETKQPPKEVKREGKQME